MNRVPNKVFHFLLILFFTNCKKEIKSTENSGQGIRYYSAGTENKVNAINKTGDGGFIYCGYSGADSARVDAFLLKVDAHGIRQWYKTYGGANYDEFINVKQTSDGGFIAVGQTNSIGVGSLNGVYCSYVLKTDMNGVEQWSKSYLSTETLLSGITETSDHNFLTFGHTLNSTPDIVLMKIDGTGKSIFLRTYGHNLSAYPPFNIINNYNEYGRFVSESSDGSIIIGGVMSPSNLQGQTRFHVTYFSKTNNVGTPSFFYPYYDFERGASYWASYDFKPRQRFPTVKVFTQADGYLIGTYIEDKITNIMQMQLIKAGPDGALQWHREYTGLGNALLYNMEPDADGGFLLVGASSAEPHPIHASGFSELFQNLKIMLMKVDKNGNEIWSKYHGGGQNASIGGCVQALPTGGWSVAGYTCPNEGGYDKMLWMQVDSDGNIVK